MTRIGCDIDGVLASIVPPILRFHNEKYGTGFELKDVQENSFVNLWKVSKEEEAKRIHDFYRSEEFTTIPMLEGADKAIEHLSSRNQLIVITSRPPFTEASTRAWLNRHFSENFAAICFTNDYFGMGGKSKCDVCKEQGITLLIEDSLKTALECAKEGIFVFLVDQPWNQSKSLPENIFRVNSWDELLKEISRREW